MADPLFKVGVLGATGYIGAPYRAEIRECDNARLVALCARRADLLEAAAAEVPEDMMPIPLESPGYSAQIDIDRNGVITAAEMREGRFAAALDRSDPSLFFGPGRSLRLGIEVQF